MIKKNTKGVFFTDIADTVQNFTVQKNKSTDIAI